MNENIKLQEQAIMALLKLNRTAVKDLLRNHNYHVKLLASDNDLKHSIILGISNDNSFTSDFIVLLQKVSQPNFRSAITGSHISSEASTQAPYKDIITGALQGLGMITTTWKDTALMRKDSSFYASDTKKTNTLVVAGVVLGGIVLLGVMAVVVIKSTK
jgi:hypothetical protein